MSISKTYGSNINDRLDPAKKLYDHGTKKSSDNENTPSGLMPIITLLSAHNHRRYLEGMFYLLKDFKSDGTAAERIWHKMYGVLIGTQLALWDQVLHGTDNNNSQNSTSTNLKPMYINFGDSTFRIISLSDEDINAGESKTNKMIAVSTSLKTRYLLRFRSKETFEKWYAAFRLSVYEFTALQESYTGAMFSTYGSLLRDIRVVLTETKFDHEEWVNIRFFVGMSWKRCYAVISHPKKGKGGSKFGKISFYETDKKLKKATPIATITMAYVAYAIYPSSPNMIDSSTMIKIEGSVLFPGSDKTAKDRDVFLIPQIHSAVPGYDTIIRFLIPTMNVFKLYGRPKSLNANRDDPKSLLFSLPISPQLHYLQVDDLLPLFNKPFYMEWSVREWREEIKKILKYKLDQGYTGCVSIEGLSGALASPVLPSSGRQESKNSQFCFTPRAVCLPSESIQDNTRVSSTIHPSNQDVSKYTKTHLGPSVDRIISNNSSQVCSIPRVRMSPKVSELENIERSDLKPLDASAPMKFLYPINEPSERHRYISDHELTRFIVEKPPKPLLVEKRPTFSGTNEIKPGVEKNSQILKSSYENSYPEVCKSREDLDNFYDKFSGAPLPGSVTSKNISSPALHNGNSTSYQNSKETSTENCDGYTEVSHSLNSESSVLKNSICGNAGPNNSQNTNLDNSLSNESSTSYNLSQEVSKMVLEDMATARLRLGETNFDNSNDIFGDEDTSSSPNVFDPGYAEEQNFLFNSESNFFAESSQPSSNTNSNIECQIDCYAPNCAVDNLKDHTAKKNNLDILTNPIFSIPIKKDPATSKSLKENFLANPFGFNDRLDLK